MLGNVIFNHWTQQSVSILHSTAHGNTCKQPGVSINPGCVHRINSALGEQWEQRSHLAGCMPPQKTELTQIVSWRALASSSLCTLPKLLGRLLCADLWEHINIVKLQHRKEEHQAFKTLRQHGHMITRSEAFIPGVGCPGLVVFGTRENSLGGGLDPVVNLQRGIYTCTETRPKQGKDSLWQDRNKSYVFL